jgi:hypothetical protein
MPKSIAIVQSSYIPWKGYFDLIASVDEFILFDDMQFTRRDWRNRNKIKTPRGAQWLTIPVSVRGKFFQKICETEVSDAGWAEVHWRTLTHYYSRAPHFRAYRDVFEELYAGPQATRLSQVNHAFLSAICHLLEIPARLTWSMDYRVCEGRTERLIELCRQAGASRYVSGPRAKDYMDESLFASAGIDLRYVDYDDYPEYHQLYPPFDHHVTILDLIFNTGRDARRYMKSP